MTQTSVETPDQAGATTDVEYDSDNTDRSPRRRSKARTRQQISRITEVRRNASALAERNLQQDVAAEELCKLVDRDRSLLSEVHLAQLRHMRNRPADDFHATATLGIIERALALLPRPVPSLSLPRWAPPTPRRFPWLGFHRRGATTGAA